MKTNKCEECIYCLVGLDLDPKYGIPSSITSL